MPEEIGHSAQEHLGERMPQAFAESQGKEMNLLRTAGGGSQRLQHYFERGVFSAASVPRIVMRTHPIHIVAAALKGSMMVRFCPRIRMFLRRLGPCTVTGCRSALVARVVAKPKAKGVVGKAKPLLWAVQVLNPVAWLSTLLCSFRPLAIAIFLPGRKGAKPITTPVWAEHYAV